MSWGTAGGESGGHGGGGGVETALEEEADEAGGTRGVREHILCATGGLPLLENDPGVTEHILCEENTFYMRMV
jgi:hypothetical protein